MTLPLTLRMVRAGSPPPPSGEFGAGPNAPDWSGKTTYPVELFNTPIPVHPGESAGASGFLGRGGFDGYFGYTYKIQRVSYPTVSTPIGTKPVLRVTFPGSRTNITGAGQSTASRDVSDDQGWSIQVTGTWVGTLQFEISTDNGGSWSSVSMEGFHGGVTGTSTTGNGAWGSAELPDTLFRVRASSWTSGTAVVDVGCRGGFAPARMTAGSFTSRPTRIYTRVLLYVDAEWTDNGNAGTKFTFFSQTQGNNHYTALWGAYGSRPDVGLQQTASTYYEGTVGPANGNWLDCEFLFTAGTAGGSDGTAKAWINGTLLLDLTGVPFFLTSTTPGFANLFMDPTYGGGRRPPPRDLYFDIAGWYRESAP
jgi:hypothetical protein